MKTKPLMKAKPGKLSWKWHHWWTWSRTLWRWIWCCWWIQRHREGNLKPKLMMSVNTRNTEAGACGIDGCSQRIYVTTNQFCVILEYVISKRSLKETISLTDSPIRICTVETSSTYLLLHQLVRGVSIWYNHYVKGIFDQIFHRINLLCWFIANKEYIFY